MERRNAQIARYLEEIADLLDVAHENAFRVRAYRNAARVLRDTGADLAEMVRRGEDLSALPGIGKDLAEKIAELIERDECALLTELRSRFPPHIRELLQIPGLGPRRVAALLEELGVRSPEELRQAAHAGRVRGLPGFGEKMEAHLLAVLSPTEASARIEDAGTRFTSGRLPLVRVRPEAEALRAYLAGVDAVEQVEIAGSYRRGKRTVGDLDLLARSGAGKRVVEALLAYPDVAQVRAQGTTRAQVELRSRLQVDLRVVPRESFGAALYYFTGSKAHNIAVRRLAQTQGLKINEYGVFRGAEYLAGQTEPDVLEVVGLPFIAPELREDRGEIEAAQANTLPRLLERSDVRGDLHVSAEAARGDHGLARLSAAAASTGLAYVGFTESVRAGEDADSAARRIRRSFAALERFHARDKRVRFLRVLEVDVLSDGHLALPDELLRDAELVVGVLRSEVREDQTARALRALDHPVLRALAMYAAHDAADAADIALDFERVVQRARERRRALLISGGALGPVLDDGQCRAAKRAGVPICLGSAARRVEELEQLALAITEARRGWLSRQDVLNTRATPELLRRVGGARSLHAPAGAPR